MQGSWKANAGPDSWDLTLEQKYQKLEGHVRLGAIQAGLREARLVGDRISFAIVDGNGLRREFSGRVAGNTIEGSMKPEQGAETRWTATKR